jgi:multidrug transporter EmrE-like cation transporter
MSYLVLFAAIGCEIAGTLLLRISHGFDRFAVGMLSVGCFIVSLGLLSAAMKHIPLSVTYPIWAGLGTVGALVGGRLIFGEQISGYQIVGVAIVLGGVIVIRLAQAGT